MAAEVFEHGLYAVNAADGSLEWRADVDDVVISPVAADDVLYAFTGETLTAYAMSDGEALASTTLEDTTGDNVEANALVGDAFVTATDDGLLAFGPTAE